MPPRLTPRADDPTADPDAKRRRAVDPDAVPPLLVRATEAARLCGVSRATWDRRVRAGQTPAPLHLGGAVVWAYGVLVAWVKAGCPPRREWEALRGAGKGSASARR